MTRQKAKTSFEEWFDASLAKDPEFAARVEKQLAAMNIEQELIALREQRGLTQADLGKRLGISQPAVAKLEGGGGNWELKTLARAAEALDATLEVRLVAGVPAVGRKVDSSGRNTRQYETRVHPGVIADDSVRYRSATGGRFSTRGKAVRAAKKK